MFQARTLAIRMILAVAMTALVLAGQTTAGVSVPHVISDHMVLQRDASVPIWGAADPGEQVTVTFADQQHETTADAAGRWQVTLSAMPASAEPRSLTIAAGNTLTFEDVLVGEVWLCSGQSNMEWIVRNTHDLKTAVEDAPNRSTIRHFNVPRTTAGKPQTDVSASWVPASVDTVPVFSAVAYFFACAVQDELDVPIGLLNSSWGGTRIQPWTPLQGLESQPTLAEDVAWVHRRQEEYRQQKRDLIQPMAAWVKQAEAAQQAGQPIPDPPKWADHPIARNVHNPTTLYNGMIAPLLPYEIRGAIWYQGESNRADGSHYANRLKGLIAGWRAVWNKPNLPFGIVQLAPYKYGDTTDLLPRTWEAQAHVARDVPYTGLAVITDLGNPRDIHPRDKQPVGQRLAKWALVTVYGHDLIYSGPVYDSMQIENSTIRINFTHVGQGLQSRDGQPLTHWQIAGEDEQFHPATARIEGSSVIVSSPDVADPVAVRFGWNEVANPNLVNSADLPASPFRTDDWPPQSVN